MYYIANMQMTEEYKQNRRKMLMQMGLAGASLGALSGIGSASSSSKQNRPSLLKEEVNLQGSERGQYISSVKNSSHFKAVKKALIDDGYKPPTGQPSATRGKVRTTDNEAKQLVFPFSNEQNTNHSATAYGLQVAESSGLKVIANVNLDGVIKRQYISSNEISAEDSSEVRIITIDEGGDK